MANDEYVGVIFALNGIAIIVHIIGSYSILSQKGWSKVNQNVILLNITIIELLLLFTITWQGTMTMIFGQDSIYSHIPQWCEFSQWMTLFVLMTYVSIDRFLRAIMGMNYNRKITVKFTKYAMFVIWGLGFSTVIPLYLIGIKEALGIMYNVVFVIFDIVVIAVAVVAYISIAFILRRSRNIVGVGSAGGNQTSRINWRPYIVPMLIILTFFTCYAVPDWSLALNKNYPFAHEYAARILWALGLISDPLIYIFFITKNRHAVLRLFGRQSHREISDDSTAKQIRANRQKKISNAVMSIAKNESVKLNVRSPHSVTQPIIIEEPDLV